MLKALLIGQHPHISSDVAVRLRELGCHCEFADSYQQACALLRNGAYDLVLSPIRMSDGSGLALTESLMGSRSTLFYSYAVEHGSWWIPALRHGRQCFGSSAVRSGEFAAALDQLIEEMHSNGIAGEAARRLGIQRAATASPIETLPIKPLRPMLAKRKVAS